jgi:hypothetical protein
MERESTESRKLMAARDLFNINATGPLFVNGTTNAESCLQVTGNQLMPQSSSDRMVFGYSSSLGK